MGQTEFVLVIAVLLASCPSIPSNSESVCQRSGLFSNASFQATAVEKTLRGGRRERLQRSALIEHGAYYCAG